MAVLELHRIDDQLNAAPRPGLNARRHQMNCSTNQVGLRSVASCFPTHLSRSDHFLLCRAC
jgi:hypothetical protein